MSRDDDSPTATPLLLVAVLALSVFAAALAAALLATHTQTQQTAEAAAAAREDARRALNLATTLQAELDDARARVADLEHLAHAVRLSAWGPMGEPRPSDPTGEPPGFAAFDHPRGADDDGRD